MKPERFWIKINDNEWECVDKAAYVRAERSVGIHNRLGLRDEPATSSFTNTTAGRTVRGMMDFLYEARRAAK